MLTKHLHKGTEIFLYLLILSIPFSKTAVEVSICAIILFWIVLCILSKKISLPESRIMLPWFIFLFICALSLFNTDYFGLSLKALFTKYLKYFLLFIAVTAFLKEKPLLFKKISYVFLISLSLVIIDAALQYFTGADIRGKASQIVHIAPKDRIRILASFSHPNDLGTYLIAAIPFAFSGFILCLNRQRHSDHTFWRGLLVFLSLITLYLTYSRGSLLALITALSTTIFLWKKKIAIGVFTLLLFFAFFAPFPFMQSLRQSVNFNSSASGSIKDRLTLWKSTATMVQERPILGWGLNTYARIIPQFVGNFDAWYTHNCYLQMASEIGIVGLVAFLILLVSLFLSFYQKFRTALSPSEKLWRGAFMTSFLAIAFHAFVDTTLFSLPMVALFWTISAIGYAFQK